MVEHAEVERSEVFQEVYTLHSLKSSWVCGVHHHHHLVFGRLMVIRVFGAVLHGPDDSRECVLTAFCGAKGEKFSRWKRSPN